MSEAVLVTGGAGYIGSHVCKRLRKAGYAPVTFDSLVTGHRDAVRWGPLVEGDLTDGDALDRVFRDHAPVAVLHFAAHAYVGESIVDPARYFLNNVGGSLSLLEAMRRAAVGRIVFSSTCTTYGVAGELPVSEDAPQHPINPYGQSKLMVERILQAYAAAYGLQHVILRYFNAAGADPEGEAGERHDPEPHLIPRALMAAAGHIPCLEIFGDDYDTPDGTCVRDYIHVSDLAEGHLLALDYLLAGRGSLAVNLATGIPSSVKEIVSAVERITGRDVPVRYSPRRPGDPPSLYADPSRASEALGFVARFQSIEEVIRTAWHHYCQSSGIRY